MLYCFFDSETTGLPNFSVQAENHTEHPGIAQLAAALVDDSRKLVASMNVIINQPEGIIISDEAVAVHGITRGMMTESGISGKLAMRMFLELVNKADTIVGHNASFDKKMVRTDLHRHGFGEHAEAFRAKPTECTMKLADPIMKMAPTQRMLAAGFTKSKPPKLEEAYEHFMGKPMENAHDAWADVKATIDVFFAVKETGAGVAAPPVQSPFAPRETSVPEFGGTPKKVEIV